MKISFPPFSKRAVKAAPQTEGERRESSLKLRKVIFWLHLATGAVAGLVIGMMSVTGVLLAFERHIVAFAERQVRTVPPPASGASRLSLNALVARAREAVPDATFSGVTLRADPLAAVLVNFGRDTTVFVDPYTGAVLGEGAKKLQGFFHAVTDWHRWLAMEGERRDTGRAITGACNAAFVVLVVSGFYLWWPRRWTRRALRAVMVPSLILRGKPRDWNWHNVAGCWSAPVLLCITLTGVVMSYQWANNLLYTLTGNEPPPPQQRRVEARPAAAGDRRSGSAPGATSLSPEGRAGRQPGAEGGPATERRGRLEARGEAGGTPPLADVEALVATAAQQAPHWRSLSVRLPQRAAPQVTVTIEEAASLHPYPRSMLTLDAATAAVVKWEPFASYNLGRTIRSWVRPVHTGEAGGLLGQIIATLASAGGAVLVWTGLSLALRRFFGRKVRASNGAREDLQP